VHLQPFAGRQRCRIELHSFCDPSLSALSRSFFLSPLPQRHTYTHASFPCLGCCWVADPWRKRVPSWSFSRLWSRPRWDRPSVRIRGPPRLPCSSLSPSPLSFPHALPLSILSSPLSPLMLTYTSPQTAACSESNSYHVLGCIVQADKRFETAAHGNRNPQGPAKGKNGQQNSLVKLVSKSFCIASIICMSTGQRRPWNCNCTTTRSRRRFPGMRRS